MAIIQRQSPTTPNLIDSDLIYVVTSNNGSEPQFQFVLKVIDKDANEVIIKQQPGPQGNLAFAKSVFNISQIAKDYMGEDNIWKTQKIARNASANEFDVIFYEETGSSVSSSVSLHNGVSGSTVYCLDGVVEMNSGDWNWPSGSFYTASFTNDDNTFKVQHALTNSPLTQSIRDDEYATLSVINGNFNNEQNYAQDIFAIRIQAYDSSNSLLQTQTYYNITGNGGAPRTLQTQFWPNSGVYNGQNVLSKLIHIGAGPQNLADAGLTLNSSWASYRVQALEQATDALENVNAIFFEKWYVKQEPECDYEGTRFSWLNELGGWDYFTFPYANGKSDSITRETYQQGFVNYAENQSFTLPYDINRRGTKQYSTKYVETRVAESDWLTTEQADWLRELVESPNVYIQSGTDFLPVVIDTSNFDYKINPRSQKMYRLTLNYKLANNRRSR